MRRHSIPGSGRGCSPWYMAMADGFIAGFRAKYDFNFWRPVTAIRAGDTHGNDDTVADLSWSTLLNTPAIPDYPSTHSVLGGAAAEVLRRFFGDDDIAFMTTSGAPFAGITRIVQQLLRSRARERRVEDLCRHPFPNGGRRRDQAGQEDRRVVFPDALKRLDSDDEDDTDRDRRDP